MDESALAEAMPGARVWVARVYGALNDDRSFNNGLNDEQGNALRKELPALLRALSQTASHSASSSSSSSSSSISGEPIVVAAAMVRCGLVEVLYACLQPLLSPLGSPTMPHPLVQDLSLRILSRILEDLCKAGERATHLYIIHIQCREVRFCTLQYEILHRLTLLRHDTVTHTAS